MLFQYRNIKPLEGLDWYMLELSDRGTDSVESTSLELALRRLTNSIPTIFKNHPCELFIPVIDRDLDKFELASGPFVYVRGDFSLLLKLKQVNGFRGLYTENETGSSKDALPCEDSFVQRLISQCEAEYQRRQAGIRVGSVVRLLDGETRDFVGTVTKIEDEVVEVEVILMTRTLKVRTCLGNCRRLDIDSPEFFYTPKEEVCV